MSSTTARSRRSGFTLTELLMVIVVIAMLAALLLPAIGSAVRKARETTVSSEINMFAQALADFKSKYGDYPPSRIMLCENGNYSPYMVTTSYVASMSGGSADLNYAQLAQRSLLALRKFWPRVVFSTSGSVPANISATNWYDFNGNGVMDSMYILDGRECLTFFLGGIPLYGPPSSKTTASLTSFSQGMIGFGRNPQNPFMNGIALDPNYGANAPNPVYSNNRVPPLFEFKGNRLLMVPRNTTSPPSYPTTYIPGYFDANSSVSTPSFYAYFSAYGGAYDPNDVNALDPNNPGNFETDANLTSLTLNFKLPFPVYSSTGTLGTTAASPPPNPYTTSLTIGVPNVTYQNSQTFQIISPGADNLYGVGGWYTPNAGIVLPYDQNNTSSSDSTVRVRERDNLTNFHNGRLE